MSGVTTATPITGNIKNCVTNQGQLFYSGVANQVWQLNFTDCIGYLNSFGGIASGLSSTWSLVSGTILRCYILGAQTGNIWRVKVDGMVRDSTIMAQIGNVTANAVLQNCTVRPPNGVAPVSANPAASIRIMKCMFNTQAMVNITNLIDTPFNITDDDLPT
jgi:hypothetical protein